MARPPLCVGGDGSSTFGRFFRPAAGDAGYYTSMSSPSALEPPTHGSRRGAAAILGRTFAAVARARGGKPVHPRGMVYEGTLRITGAAGAPSAVPFLTTPAEHSGLIRFSRSIGLPAWLPDAFGIAVRLPDLHGLGRHQDFLLVTSFDHPVLHHLLIATRDAQARAYSSSLPYVAGDERVIIGALPLPDSPRPAGPTADERLIRAAATGRLRFALAVAAYRGRFSPVGELRIGRRLPPDREAIAFDPYNSGGGLRPTGALNRLRPAAYAGARAGRIPP